MRTFVLVCGLLFLANQTASLRAEDKKPAEKKAIYSFQATTIDGEKLDLAKYKGKVLMIVNVASECGSTDQYKGLQTLHAKYGKEGLVILAFPCNDFGGQEPGDEAKIKTFVKNTYNVEFPMFSKIKILGKDAAPLYRFLTSAAANPRNAGAVQWNFEKFIIARDGTIVARFLSDTEPESDNVVNVLRKELLSH